MVGGQGCGDGELRWVPFYRRHRSVGGGRDGEVGRRTVRAGLMAGGRVVLSRSGVRRSGHVGAAVADVGLGSRPRVEAAQAAALSPLGGRLGGAGDATRRAATSGAAAFWARAQGRACGAPAGHRRGGMRARGRARKQGERGRSGQRASRPRGARARARQGGVSCGVGERGRRRVREQRAGRAVRARGGRREREKRRKEKKKRGKRKKK